MKFRLRFLTYILITVVLINSCFNACSFSVQASSIQSVEASAEIAMVIYEILESAAIAGGVKEGLSDYESGKTLYDSFIGALRSASLAGDPGWLKDELGYVTLTDGNVINLGDYINNNLTDGSSALELPDEDIWNKFRVVDGGDSSDPDSGDNGDQGDDDKNSGKFALIAAVSVGAGFLIALGDYLTDAWNGEVEDIDKADYLSGYFNGYDRDAEGHYLISGTVDYNPNSTQHGVYTLSGYVSSFMPVAYFLGNNIYFLYLNPVNGAFYNSNSSQFTVSMHSDFKRKFDLYLNLDGSLVSTTNGNVSRYVECTSRSYKLNIPVFESGAQALSYFQNGDQTGLLNGEVYDFPLMAESVPETLQPLTGINFHPGVLSGFNNALALAAASASTAGAIADNTVDYVSQVSQALADNLPDNIEITEPDPEPGPVVSPDYSGILQRIYNGILRLIEIFPEQIELVLGNIELLPQALFDLLSNPLAAIYEGIQSIPSAIGALKEGLFAYLDELLEAVKVPWFDNGDSGGSGGSDDDGSSSEGGSSFELPSLLNSLILIILILIALLRIFLHCLKFIICIFRIPASQGFLPDEMVMGLDYLKTLEITGMGISVFDFMMGLIHIMIIFGVVQLLRKVVDKIHLPHR